MRTYNVLDVGCGLNPRGTINIDLFIDSTHRRGGNGENINVKNIDNFIIGSGLNLMFENNSIDFVKCYHVIEHIKYPYCFELIKELYRVTKKRLTIVTPSRYWLKLFQLKRSKTHISFFDAETFRVIIPKLLDTYNFKIITEYRGLIHKFIPIISMPYLIKVEVWK